MSKTIFDTIRTARSRYAEKYDSITKTFNDSKNNAIKDFKGKRLQEELSKLKADYASSLQKERDKVLDFVTQKLTEIRENEEVKVRVIDDSTLNRLESLKGLPLSTAEMSALINQFSGKSYWVDRYLKLQAEKNGIDALFPTDYGTKMKILDEIESGITDFVNSYCGAGNTKYIVMLNVSDSRVYELEREFTSDHAFSRLGRSELADRAIATVYSQADTVSRGIMLRNAMANADEKLKAAILYKLSQDESNLTDDLLSIAGIKSQYQEFRECEVPNIRAAEKLLKELGEMEDSSDISARLVVARENGEVTKQFVETVREAVVNGVAIHDGSELLAEGLANCDSPELVELVTKQSKED